MSELIRLAAEEQARRDAIEESRVNDRSLVDLYRTMKNHGLHLAEIPILRPVAESLSDFAYSCSVAGLAKVTVARRQRSEIIQTGIFHNKQRTVYHDATPTWRGWKVQRYFRESCGDSDFNDENYCFYVDESDFVMLDEVDPENFQKIEWHFDLNKIKKSMTSTLLDNHIKPLERPRE